MKIINNIKEIANNLMLSIKRFPLTVLSSTITTVILIIIVNNDSLLADNTVEILKQLAMTTALAFPLLLIFNLTFERFKTLQKKYKYLSYFAVFLFLISYYFYIFEDFQLVSTSRFIALNISFYLLVLLAHYFYKRENYELYIAEIFSRFSVSAVYAAVLFIGLTAILFTVDHLFELSLSGDVYLTAWLMAAGIFAPIYLLAGVPLFAEEFNLKDYSSFLRVLLLYIVMPLILVYTFILYLYFIKILITQVWPESIVGHLVLWYSMISFTVMFFIKPFKKNNKWASSFIFWMPKLILPLLIMMFSALWIRISEYGITENRYYVFLMGSWIFAAMLYYNFSKKKKNTLLVLSLATITILAVFGPWSSFSISMNSQNNRFTEILKENNLLKDGKIVKSEDSLTPEVKKEINSIIRYFDYNHSLEELKYLPDNFKKDDMINIFGFKYQSYYRDNMNYFYHEIPLNKKILNIEGYNYFFELSFNGQKEKIIAQIENDLTVDFNKAEYRLNLNRGEEEIFSKSLKEDLFTLHSRIENLSREDLEELEQNYQYENERAKIKIVFKNFSGEISEDKNSIDLYHLNILTFIKIK